MKKIALAVVLLGFLGPGALPSTIASEAAAPTGTIRLTGTIVAIDQFGVEHAAEDGSFRLALAFQTGFRTAAADEIAVHDGVWSCELCTDVCVEMKGVSVLACSLRGRAAVPVEGRDHLFTLPADGRLCLRVRWIDNVTLHVRARDSGRELEEVWLHESIAGSDEASLERPALHERGELAGRSPLRLAPLADPSVTRRVLHARSPGYAWGRIEFDVSEGRALDLVLSPSGELEIVLADEPRNPTTWVHLFRAGGLPDRGFLDETVGSSPSVLLQDLPADRYIVQAHWDRRFEPVLIGSLNAEVKAGVRTTVRLATVAPTYAPVPFGGVLILPEEWRLPSFQLRIQGEFGRPISIDRADMTAETETRLRWIAPCVQPGRYVAEIGGVPVFGVLLDTGPTGTLDARVEVPPPCSVTVLAVDATTGAPIDEQSPPQMTLWLKRPRRTAGWLDIFDALGGWSAAGLAWNPERLCWSLRVPQGAAKFQAVSDDHECPDELVLLGPGQNDIVLQMKRKR